MKSLVLVSPDQLEIQERAIPTPQQDEVLLRVEWAGICHTDIYTMHGGYRDLNYPAVLGHEFSATGRMRRGTVWTS